MPISGSSMATSSRSDSMPGSRAKFSAPRRWWVIALVAPLLLFLLVSFVAPVLLMLSRAVTDRELQTVWPESAAALRQWDRSEEHTSELQSLMRISYAVFCLKKKTI